MKRPTFSRAVAPILIFAASLIPRLALLVTGETYHFEPVDNYVEAGWETGQIAANLARGRGFSMSWGTPEPAATAWLAPIYPGMVAGVYRIFGIFTTPAFVAILVLQIVLSALGAGALYLLGVQLRVPTAGLLAGLLFASSPPAIRESAELISSTALLVLLVLLGAAALLTLERRPSWRLAVLTGGLVGLTLLVEPTPAPFFLAAAAWIAFRRGSEGLRAALIMGSTAALVVAPWVYRNHRVFGEIFFIKSNFGQELFIGNNPEATGFWAPPGETAARVLDAPTQEKLRSALRSADEPTFSRILGAAAIEHMRENPRQTARLTTAKVYHFWLDGYSSPSWPIGERLGVTLERASRVTQYVVLALALAGAFLALRSKGALLLPVLFLAAYPVAFYLTHVGHERYRFPTVGFLYLLAAFALVQGLGAYRNRRATTGPTRASQQTRLL